MNTDTSTGAANDLRSKAQWHQGGVKDAIENTIARPSTPSVASPANVSLRRQCWASR